FGRVCTDRIAVAVWHPANFLREFGYCRACDLRESLISPLPPADRLTLRAKHPGIKNSDATGAVFKDVDFVEGYDLSGVNFTHAILENVFWGIPQLQGATLKGTMFKGDTDLEGPSFHGLALESVVFVGQTLLDQTDFS